MTWGGVFVWQSCVFDGKNYKSKTDTLKNWVGAACVSNICMMNRKDVQLDPKKSLEIAQ